MKKSLTLFFAIALTFGAFGQTQITVSNFAELQSAIASYATATDDIVINVATDITITSPVNIPALADSGRAITIRSTNLATPATLLRDVGGNLFDVGSRATLILENIIIEGDRDGAFAGAILSVQNFGTLVMNEGALLHNNVTPPVMGGATIAGVSVLGTFIMNGGEISRNTVLGGGGAFMALSGAGGVWINGGVFIMHGGEISNNASGGHGGGVWVNNGTFIMYSGKIRSNSSDIGSDGGGVWVNNGTFIMHSGEISNNTGGHVFGNAVSGNNGNGVRVNGTFIMYSGKITNNTITGTGTGILGSGVRVDGVFIMHDGEISGNSGLGISLGAGSGTTFVMYSGEISENTTDGIEGRTGTTLTIHGGKISRNGLDGVVLTGALFTMYGGEISRNRIGVRSSGGTFIMHSGKISNSTFYGVDNISGNFIMHDGEISRNSRGVWSGGTTSSFTMYGGKISENVNDQPSRGGAVFAGGVFIMHGGKISRNSSMGSGGGVEVSRNGNFIMRGGQISENSTNSFGGGVEVWGTGIFTMIGGQITNNTSVLLGGGVIMSSEGSNIPTFILGGTAVISNNAQNNIQSNVVFRNNHYAILSTDTPPRAGMDVGVTKEFNNGIFVESGATPNHVQFFTADAQHLGVFHNSPQGELQLRTCIGAEWPNITQHPQGSAYTHNSPATALTITADVSDGGTLTYQWFRNTTNSIVGGTPISGATSTSHIPSTTRTMYYWVVVTNTIPDNGDGCHKTRSIASDIARIEVLLDINISANPAIAGTVSGGGTGIAYGTSVTVQATPSTGYSFVNWTESGTVISTNASYTFIATNSRALVANFTPTVFNITYVLGGGTNHASNPATFTIETPTITLQNPTRNGFTFAGWAEGNSIPLGSTGDRTFTAQWNIIYYDITYILNGGTNHADNPATFTIETPTIILQNPTRTNYFFAGWAEGNTIPLGSTGDKTFTAQWSNIVNALPPIITVHPQSATYSQNATANNLTVTATSPDGGTLTFQWFSNTTNSNIGGTAINGATTANFTPSTTTVGTMFYFVVVTNTIADNGDGGTKTATATSFVAEIIVTPLLNINVSANPAIAGTVLGGGVGIAYGTSVTVQANANIGWNFVNWTENGTEVSTSTSYTLTATSSRTLVANFTLTVFNITYVLNGGTNHPNNPTTFTIETPTIVLQNPTRTGYFFAGWAEGSTIPQGSTGDKTFTAQWQWEPPIVSITTSTNPPTAGSAMGGQTNITHGTSVTISATANECWQFVSWTSNGVEVSTQNPFSFSATETANLVANFDGPTLDFDTYASTLWNNTFMLNLNRLRADGFEALDARWFRNGIEIIDTRTGSAFSYSAGPNASDRLELAPTFYHFEIFTERCGMVASTPKTIASHNPTVGAQNFVPLHVFPNPIQSGGTITLENTTAGHKIQIFNRSGMLVKSAVATDGTTLLTLNIPQGIYVIHVDNNTVQILVTE